MCRYQCFNPVTWSMVETDYMGEADFWAGLGYTIVDTPHKIQLD